MHSEMGTLIQGRRHYVAFIRKQIPDEGESWVLFNDEKVVKAEGDVDEMKKFAYVYFFERVWHQEGC